MKCEVLVGRTQTEFYSILSKLMTKFFGFSCVMLLWYRDFVVNGFSKSSRNLQFSCRIFIPLTFISRYYRELLSNTVLIFVIFLILNNSNNWIWISLVYNIMTCSSLILFQIYFLDSIIFNCGILTTLVKIIIVMYAHS